MTNLSLDFLASKLKKLRISAGLSGYKLAELVGTTQASVSRIESTQQRPTPEILDRWLSATNADEQVRLEVLASFEDVLNDFVSNRIRLQNGHGAYQESIAEGEKNVSLMRTFQSHLVPGLLQTPRYAEMIFSLGPSPYLPEKEIRRGVEARKLRQSRLFDVSCAFDFLIMETAFLFMYTSRNISVDSDLLDEQIDHIINIQQLNNVSIGIIPIRAPLPFVPISSFHSDDDALITVGMLSGSYELQKAEDVSVYIEVFDTLKSLSHPPSSEWKNEFMQKNSKII